MSDPIKSATETVAPIITTISTPAATPEPVPVKTVEPVVKPAEPVVKPVESAVATPEPVVKPAEPVVKPAEPVTTTLGTFLKSQPYFTTVEPQPPSPSVAYFERLNYLLETYITTMRPGKVMQVQDGVNAQKGLYTLFQHMLNADTFNAKQAFDTVMFRIQQLRDTIFHETNVYRYMNKLNIPLKEQKLFEQLIHIFINSSDPNTRAVMIKQIDLNQLSKYLSSNKQLINISNYFSNRF